LLPPHWLLFFLLLTTIACCVSSFLFNGGWPLDIQLLSSHQISSGWLMWTTLWTTIGYPV